MATETKIGFLLILVLLGAFGYVVYRKMDKGKLAEEKSAQSDDKSPFEIDQDRHKHAGSKPTQQTAMNHQSNQPGHFHVGDDTPGKTGKTSTTVKKGNDDPFDLDFDAPRNDKSVGTGGKANQQNVKPTSLIRPLPNAVTQRAVSQVGPAPRQLAQADDDFFDSGNQFEPDADRKSRDSKRKADLMIDDLDASFTEDQATAPKADVKRGPWRDNSRPSEQKSPAQDRFDDFDDSVPPDKKQQPSQQQKSTGQTVYYPSTGATTVYKGAEKKETGFGARKDKFEIDEIDDKQQAGDVRIRPKPVRSDGFSDRRDRFEDDDDHFSKPRDRFDLDKKQMSYRRTQRDEFGSHESPFDVNPDVAHADEPLPAGCKLDVHVVREDENYWTISKQRYGTAKYFSALARFNQSRIPDPKKMRPGMKVLIPEARLLEARYPELLGYCGGIRQASAGGEEYEGAIPKTPGFFRTSAGQPMYRVGRADTLTDISLSYLGRQSRWVQIFSLNRDRLADPHNLTIGTVLRLPADATQVVLAGERRENR